MWLQLLPSQKIQDILTGEEEDELRKLGPFKPEEKLCSQSGVSAGTKGAGPSVSGCPWAYPSPLLLRHTGCHSDSLGKVSQVKDLSGQAKRIPQSLKLYSYKSVHVCFKHDAIALTQTAILKLISKLRPNRPQQNKSDKRESCQRGITGWLTSLKGARGPTACHTSASWHALKEFCSINHLYPYGGQIELQGETRFFYSQ